MARALPVSVFRAAGFSLRGFSPLDGLRMVLDPVYENGNCSRYYSLYSLLNSGPNQARSIQSFRVCVALRLVGCCGWSSVSCSAEGSSLASLGRSEVYRPGTITRSSQ